MNANLFKIGFFVVMLALLCASVPVSAVQDEAAALFREGNRAYVQEEYEQALAHYREAVETGYVSFELYFNMGNACFKLGDMGHAILYYEKARRLRPDDEDLLSNIQLANVNIVDRITPIPEVFYVRYWNAFRNALPHDQWKLLFFAAWFFTAATVSLRFFLRQRETQRLLKIGLAAGAVVTLLSCAVLFSDTVIDPPERKGVVMSEEVSAFASPTETGTEVFRIHEGAVVAIRRGLDGWTEIRLADGKVGWIPSDSYEII